MIKKSLSSNAIKKNSFDYDVIVTSRIPYDAHHVVKINRAKFDVCRPSSFRGVKTNTQTELLFKPIPSKSFKYRRKITAFTAVFKKNTDMSSTPDLVEFLSKLIICVTMFGLRGSRYEKADIVL